MSQVIVALILLVGQLSAKPALPARKYDRLRNEILKYEERLMIGADLILTEVEEAANRVLMKAKNEEMDAGFADPRVFAPARNFIEAKTDIEKSKVFKLLQRMPKGALLHSHDTSLASGDFVFNNITFRDDLYVCVVKDVVKLRFFHVPDHSCDWQLLKKVREDPKRTRGIDAMIKARMSMEVSDPTVVYTNVNQAWSKFADIFDFIDPLVTYKPVYEDHFYEALKQLYEDNVMYLELRTTLPALYDFQGTVYTPEDIVEVYRKTAERFKEDHPDFIGVKLIYAPVRSVPHKTMENATNVMKRLKNEYPDFVAGFDLVGQEDKGNTLEYFADLLADDEWHDVNFFFHAGETNWLGASTDENLVDALLFHTKRIGHGYALTSHPFLLDMAKRMDIALEINPISNQVLKLVDDLRNHAARPLFATGYPLVISSDDPGFWGAKALSYDFYEAFMGLMSRHADLRSLKQLAMNSIKYSSLNVFEKERAMILWQERWRTYVEEVANEES